MTDSKTVRKALEFYAAKHNYSERFEPACYDGCCTNTICPSVLEDAGALAAEALAALDRIEATQPPQAAEVPDGYVLLAGVHLVPGGLVSQNAEGRIVTRVPKRYVSSIIDVVIDKLYERLAARGGKPLASVEEAQGEINAAVQDVYAVCQNEGRVK